MDKDYGCVFPLFCGVRDDDLGTLDLYLSKGGDGVARAAGKFLITLWKENKNENTAFKIYQAHPDKKNFLLLACQQNPQLAKDLAPLIGNTRPFYYIKKALKGIFPQEKHSDIDKDVEFALLCLALEKGHQDFSWLQHQTPLKAIVATAKGKAADYVKGTSLADLQNAFMDAGQKGDIESVSAIASYVSHYWHEKILEHYGASHPLIIQTLLPYSPNIPQRLVEDLCENKQTESLLMIMDLICEQNFTLDNKTHQKYLNQVKKASLQKKNMQNTFNEGSGARSLKM